jgi:D-xylose transport system permease protein
MTVATPSSEVESLDTPSASSSTDFLAQIKRIWQGDSGLLPILIGLAALVIFFEVRTSVFLKPENISNLFIQSTIFILLGMGEIWLLLLGDIDLSLGYATGLGGAVSVILVSNNYNWPWYLALPLALLVTTATSAFSAFICIRFRLPSFIVTLAMFLGLEGVLLYIIDAQGTGGSISVQNNILHNLIYGDLTPLATWIFVIVAAALTSFLMLRADRARRTSGLGGRPMWITITKIVLLGVASLVLILVFNANRSTFAHVVGMPFAIPIDLFVLAVGTFILTKTKAGRYVYAIGGNVEAARRAGISVNRYRLMAFMLSGLTAGIAGLLYVSNLNGISTGIEGGTYVLYAVAAAVIGGASLYGGRGKMIHAVLGGLVIGTIDNGMSLINLSASSQYIVTALVLLAAVIVDSIARRGNTNTR